MFDKSFKVALLISLSMHSVALAPWSAINITQQKKPQTDIEVTYFHIEKTLKPKIKKETFKTMVPAKKAVKLEVEKITKKEPPAAKEEVPVKKALPVKEIQSEKISEIARKTISKKEIKLKSTPELEGNISYLSYSQLIREKIKQRLYRNYRESMGRGEIAVNFVLRSNGTLKALEVIKNRSTSNNNLHNLCIESIKRTSPFKPFPKELNFKEIAFTITVSFTQN